MLLRQKILKRCRDDIYHFLDQENGQIAIYDAVNPLSAGRRSLAKEFAKHGVQVCPSSHRNICITGDAKQQELTSEDTRHSSSSQLAQTNVSSRRMFVALKYLRPMLVVHQTGFPLIVNDGL